MGNLMGLSLIDDGLDALEDLYYISIMWKYELHCGKVESNLHIL